MPLTDTKIKKAKPNGKVQKLNDGDGLRLEITKAVALRTWIHHIQAWQEYDANPITFSQINAWQKPIYFLDCQQDYLMPYNLKAMQPNVRFSSVDVIQKCGHFPWIEQPKTFYALLKKYLNAPSWIITMNQFNPKKLKLSKWTAVNPVNRQKHFIVVAIQVDEEQQNVISCTLEAVMTKNKTTVVLQDLKNSQAWLQGWK